MEEFVEKLRTQEYDEDILLDTSKIIDIIKYEMETAYEIKVPLTVDINYGLNWLEAH